MSQKKKQSVCIIGAGYAGLCACRNLMEKYNVTLFERQETVGGLWNYSSKTGLDHFNKPVHSAMYKNVRTNFPKNIMDFPDFKFGESIKDRSFVTHQEVLHFLNNYADKFCLRSYIKFSSYVNHVEPAITCGDEVAWKVTVTNRLREVETFVFDKLFVCTGHFSKPQIPDNFKELMGNIKRNMKIIHSHDYREPEMFGGQIVCVVGAGPSGIDISTDIAQHAEQVFICHSKNREHIPFPENVVQKGKVSSVQQDSVILETGEEVRVDAIVLCTGYRFHFPFFHDSVRLAADESTVYPLHKQLCHMDYPDSLFFVGLQRQVAQGYLIDVQMKYILFLLEHSGGSSRMREGLRLNDQDWNAKLLVEMPKKKFFKLGPLFRDYVRMLEREMEVSDSERIPPVIFDVFEDVISHHDVCTLRESNYIILDSLRFAKVPAQLT